MASSAFTLPWLLCFLFSLSLLMNPSMAARRLTTESTKSSDQQDTMLFQYHKGPLLAGNISVNVIWYGKFTPAQRAVVSDFITSLSPTSKQQSRPSVSTWWASLSKYYRLANPARPASLSLSLGKQVLDEAYSVGKSVTVGQLQALAASEDRTGGEVNSITVLLTSSDVAVDGFCRSRCGTHWSSAVSKRAATFIWVGNSVTQCPGMCAWPFHQPVYGPQGPPLVAPNNDVGMDGMLINLAVLLAGTATNPFGDGYFQGPKVAPLEAASACAGVYGTGAYPGYAGDLLVDPTSGASYNAHGVNGRMYLLPGLFDPATSTCSTLV
ncbi:Phosphate-induced protein 1 conserved region [Dionaea muscipula]